MDGGGSCPLPVLSWWGAEVPKCAFYYACRFLRACSLFIPDVENENVPDRLCPYFDSHYVWAVNRVSLFSLFEQGVVLCHIDRDLWFFSGWFNQKQ